MIYEIMSIIYALTIIILFKFDNFIIAPLNIKSIPQENKACIFPFKVADSIYAQIG